MADDVTERNRDEVPLQKKLDDLYALIDGIEVAMMTTRRPDGQLVSRAMQTQERRAHADLWFVTNWESDKLDELALDPHVNLAYYKDRTREWVSVSGRAILTRDRDLVRGLYKPDWKAWFPEQDGGRDGGPDDPRIALILVEAQSVVYSKKDRPALVAAFQIARAMLGGGAPKVADLRTVTEEELRQESRPGVRPESRPEGRS
jgi:general stress protein 26